MHAATESEIQQLEDRMDAEGFRGIWIIFHDYSGRASAKWIPRPVVPDALRSGGIFARANLNFTIDDHQVPEPRFGANTGDFFAIPDPGTFAPVPYRPGIARVFSYLHTEHGDLWEGCPRGRLNNTLSRLADRGLSARVAFESEFTLFKKESDRDYEPADHFAMYSTDRIDRDFEFLSEIEETLNLQHLRVIQIGSEYGAGQLEINLHHELPLKAADDFLTMRETVRAIARDTGQIATFMPKPFTNGAGNGLHVHLSLWDESGQDDRSSGDGEFGMSMQLKQFIAGVLAHAEAVCGVGSPTVNSYKRLQPASWAPAHIAYGRGNRAALVRIPGSSRVRMEFRAGDNSSNPYLFLTALIGAGIDGLVRELDPGAPAEFDLGLASEELLREDAIRYLPRSAGDALDAVEADAVVMEALGPVCGPELLRVKRYELDRYNVHVSRWERDVYLERL